MLGAVAAALLALGAFFAIRALTGSEDKVNVKDPTGNEVELPKPEGWTRLSDEELAKLPGDRSQC